MQRIPVLLVSATLVAQGSVLRAQSANFDFGLHGGATISRFKTIAFIGIPRNQLTCAYAFGASVHYQVKKRYSIQSGLVCETVGVNEAIITRWNESTNDEIWDVVRNRLTYARMPIIGRIGFGKRKRLFLGVGGYMGYLTSTAGRIVYKETTATPETDHLYQKFDFGLAANISFQAPVTDCLAFSTEARFCKGIPVITDQVAYPGEKVKTTSLVVLLGVVYGFGRN